MNFKSISLVRTIYLILTLTRLLTDIYFLADESLTLPVGHLQLKKLGFALDQMGFQRRLMFDVAWGLGFAFWDHGTEIRFDPCLTPVWPLFDPGDRPIFNPDDKSKSSLYGTPQIWLPQHNTSQYVLTRLNAFQRVLTRFSSTCQLDAPPPPHSRPDANNRHNNPLAQYSVFD
jgi:hypothetical protein